MEKPKLDSRPNQAIRVADYMEQHPACTAKEINSVCDAGCISKVLSDMPRMGYGTETGWRYSVTKHGYQRRERTYALLYRPTQQSDLFTPP